MTLRCDTILRDATIFDGAGGPRRRDALGLFSLETAVTRNRG